MLLALNHLRDQVNFSHLVAKVLLAYSACHWDPCLGGRPPSSSDPSPGHVRYSLAPDLTLLSDTDC